MGEHKSKGTNVGVATRLVVSLFILLFLLAKSTFAQTNPTRELMLAAARGDSAAIPNWVALGADLGAGLNPKNGELGRPGGPDSNFSSAIIVSIYCGCVDVTNVLLAAGAKPKFYDLFTGIWLNQPKVVRALLDYTSPSEGLAGMPLIPMLTQRMSGETSMTLRRLMVRQILTGEALDEPGPGLAQMGVAAFVRDPADGVADLLDALLARGFDIDDASEGQTARESASSNGDVLFARALASRGATLPAGWSDAREKEIQLVGAARVGNLAGVMLLLAEGASSDSSDTKGDYALAAAIAGRNFQIAQKLIDAGADPRRFGANQPSPLTSAAALDQEELVIRLIEKGARADQLDHIGTFPLREAAREGATRAIVALLARGATASFLDTSHRTALHGMIVRDGPSWTPQSRPLTIEHLEAISLLAAAGLPLGALDSNGHSVLASNLVSKPNRDLVYALLTAGARATKADLHRARELGDSGMHRILLSQREPGPLPFSLLEAAAYRLDSHPDVAVALLEHGVELPVETEQQLHLLVLAAGAPSETALGLLLARGVPITVDSRGEALEVALANGRPKSVALLAMRGADLHAKDGLGRTALHRFVQADASGYLPSRIEGPQRSAIAALIDAGFVLGTPDKEGKAASAFAVRKASTLTAFNQAVAAAGATTKGIHASVRFGRLDELRRLAVDPVQREARDTLGRTPLSLALQSASWPAARILLRAGAAISLSSAEPWQPADTMFTGERAIASAFAVRLLSTTLIDIPTNTTASGLQTLRQAYRDGKALPVGDFVWRVRCQATGIECGDGILLAGNQKTFQNLIESVRIERGTKTVYGLIQSNLRSINWRIKILGADVESGDVTFLLTGAVTVAPCNFSFEHPGCSPGIRIHNPNSDSGLSMLTDTGYEKLPTANLRYLQANGSGGVLAPDESVVLDRSDGPITLEMDEVRARVFSLSIEVERLEGEVVDPLPEEPSTTNRMALYSRLAHLHRRRVGIPVNASERVAAKTLASTIAAVSAEAYLANYPKFVLALLRQQAEVIAGLDLQILAIQNAVRAQAAYTSAQIAVLISQIDTALTNSATGDSAALCMIRAELVKLRASAENTGLAVNELRNTLHTDADSSIELYQALVLEYRQYVPSNSLDSVLSSEVRNALAARISGREVLIDNAAADGTGKALRANFGLPDPLL